MNRLHRLLWIPTLLVVGACSHDESSFPLAPQEERIPIALNVQSVNGMQNASRTMIDNLDDLKTACTPTDEGGEGKGIGIWADYDIDESGNTVTYNIFKNITLVYSRNEGDNPIGTTGEMKPFGCREESILSQPIIHRKRPRTTLCRARTLRLSL